MKKKRILPLIGVAGIALALSFMFTNCSDVGFEDSPSGEQGPVGENALEEDYGYILDQLPPEEIANPIPITELENDPTLYDRYRCLDSSGVVICHFPDNVEAQHTQCVGRPAVSTHYDHLRDYDLGDGLKEIQDYLGPCRVAL